ncbi:uncharacterized protein LOC143430509 [Xylocopa sonorina]|uniref:uncharacterized protein LOC143430509 n=1 Tax=Xylocopa sonorina TaxID=1818115 RepID=UPI00403B29C7
MDRFLNIDWNPLLEDIIDNNFINEERLEKESVMHRIMTGNFTDPFKDIEDDYKDVKIDLIQNILPELVEKNDTNELDENGEPIEAKKPYIPGIVKPGFRFPCRSKLNKEQQAICLRVLLRFSARNMPKMTQTEREELQIYMDLQQVISKEQDEFLNFARSKWSERSLHIMHEKYINLRWNTKLQHIRKLPKYYAEVTDIPFVTNKNVEMKFISECLRMGEIPDIILPPLTKPYMLRVSLVQLQKRFPPKKNTSNNSSACFKLPVSEDINCQKLAEDNNVDLVISSSGLNCLLNNMGPNYSNSWLLPIVIKRHNDKNVIYIDKAAPPVGSTIPEKNNLVYKYILKYFCINSIHSTFKSKEKYNDNIFGDFNSEEILKLEEKYEHTSAQVNNESCSTVPKKDDHIEDSSEPRNVKSDANSSGNSLNSNECLHTTPNSSDTSINNNKDTKNEKPQLAKDNVSYKLFTIGPKLSEQNDLMKDVIKEYKILVRTKTDGYETLKNNTQRLLQLSPKLEHQGDLGAEVVTLEEALKQWISLTFRPHTFLARVRILAQTSEVLQIEHRTAISISNEVKRLYDIKVEDCLIILHNTIQIVANLSPGQYVIRHTVRNGAFATIFKAVESPGKNIFDMHSMYDEKFHTLQNHPWIPLDKTIATPMQKCFQRMPALFYPSNNNIIRRNQKYKKKKEPNTGTVRRSLRNKKKK